MLVLLSDGGLKMYDNGGVYEIDGVTFRNLDQAVDYYASLIDPDEKIVFDELGVFYQ